MANVVSNPMIFSFARWSGSPIYWHACPNCYSAISREKITVAQLRPPGLAETFSRGDAAPTDDGGSFAASYTCASCKANVTAAGVWGVDVDFVEDEHGYPREKFETVFRPGWLSHFPKLVAAPSGVPTSIASALLTADALFWADLNACGWGFRHVVEVFLDEQGVARFKTRPDGTPGKFRSFEERIEDFVLAVEKESKEAADEYEHLLRAAKFSGNDATHGAADLKQEDIRLLARMLGRVLEMRYSEDDLLTEAARIIGGRQSRRARMNSRPATPAPTDEGARSSARANLSREERDDEEQA